MVLEETHLEELGPSEVIDLLGRPALVEGDLHHVVSGNGAVEADDLVGGVFAADVELLGRRDCSQRRSAGEEAGEGAQAPRGPGGQAHSRRV